MDVTDTEAAQLFRRLDSVLQQIPHDFYKDPREFRSLVKVLEVLNDRVSTINNGDIDTSDLHATLSIINGVIEDIVTFQHGGLNNSLDTMSEVVNEYSRGQDEIISLRSALGETQKVLTARKLGQTSLRELWTKRVEVQETLRITKMVEDLKNVPNKVHRMMGQKRYYSTVKTINGAIDGLFGEDLMNIGGLTVILQHIMEMKEHVLTDAIDALKDAVLGTDNTDFIGIAADSESDEEMLSDSKSESSRNLFNGSSLRDDRSTFSVSKSVHDILDESAWSTDLSNFDEASESAAVLDLSSSNPLFIRLIVKAIVMLGCEEDALRLLLDRLPNRFFEFYLQQQKSSICQQLSKLACGSEDTASNTKYLGRYVAFLLDNVLAVIKRLAFVVNLLSNSNKCKSPTGDNVDAAIATDLIGLWDNIEDMVMAEIRPYLVSSEIENISDQVRARETEAEADLEHSDTFHKLVVKPSSQYAPIVFRRIAEYNSYSVVLLRDIFGISSQQELARPLMGYIHQFLESEFIPMIQSDSNRVVRELSLNSDFYFAQQKSADDTITPCMAAIQVGNSTDELFAYYRDLYQHRDMICVVVDRLLRGFVGAARDFLETKLFAWAFVNGVSISEDVVFMRGDLSFLTLKRSLFGGKQSLEESIGVQFDSSSSSVSDITGMMKELTQIWNEKYWDLEDPEYLTKLNMVAASEGQVVGSLLGIVHGIDWLLKRFLVSIKKSEVNSTAATRARELSKPLTKTSLKRDDVLRGRMYSPLKEVVQVLEESIAALRLLVQMHCFVFIHGAISHFLFSDTSSKNSLGRDGSRLDYSFLVDDSTVQSLILQLAIVADAAVHTGTKQILPVVFGPVVVLIPRLILNFFIRLASRRTLPGWNSAPKTAFLRFIVSIQQHLSVFLQGCLSGDIEAKRRLIDLMTEEFERVRRYLSASIENESLNHFDEK